jgi:hypothetical protein
MKLTQRILALFLAFSLCAATAAKATERNFAYTYEVTTLSKGTFELENWATWKHRHGANQFDFRHELEIGVTDKFELSLYFANWSVRDGQGIHKAARYEDSSVEAIYNLTNPVTDTLGSAIYGEVTVGDRHMELEGKLLLQKNFGPLIVAYNAALEAEFEGAHLDDRTGEFSQTLGVSYAIKPQLSVGAEAVHEIEWPSWAKPETSRVFVGPNISAKAGRFYATLTPLVQLTNVRDEPRLETRLIVGFTF